MQPQNTGKFHSAEAQRKQKTETESGLQNAFPAGPSAPHWQRLIYNIPLSNTSMSGYQEKNYRASQQAKNSI